MVVAKLLKTLLHCFEQLWPGRWRCFRRRIRSGFAKQLDGLISRHVRIIVVHIEIQHSRTLAKRLVYNRLTAWLSHFSFRLRYSVSFLRRMVVGNRCWICFTFSEKYCFVSDFSLKMCIKSEKKMISKRAECSSRYMNMTLRLYFDKASCKGQNVAKKRIMKLAFRT